MKTQQQRSIAPNKDGGRVIAVGTTVVRALESIAQDVGHIASAHGYTQLHLAANSELQVVDGLLTGLHEPDASHLDLLSAFVPVAKIQPAMPMRFANAISGTNSEIST